MSLSKMPEDYRNKKREFPTYEEPAAIASHEPCADPIVERNVSLLRERSAVGVQKYGTTLADNKLPLRAWLNHALEEALDQANYLQAAMAEIDSAKRSLPPLPQYFPDVTNIRADEELRAQQYAQDYARAVLAVAPARESCGGELYPFAVVVGRTFGMDDQIEFAFFNGENYSFSDGDCFKREGDTLDGFTAEFLTHNQFERRFVAAAPAQTQEPAAFDRLPELSDEIKAMVDAQDAKKNAELNRAPARPVAVADFLGKAFVTLESDGGRYSIVMKFNQKSDAFAAHDFLLRAGGKDYNGTAPAAHGDAKDAERWRFMMASVDSEDSQEALLLQKLGNEDFTDDASESAQMTALVDAAIAAKAESTPQ